VVFLGFAQISFAAEDKPLMRQQRVAGEQSGEFRETRGRGWENAFGTRVGEFIQSLNLTEEQKAEIKKIWLGFQKEAIELRSKIQIKELEVKELCSGPQTDLTKVRAKLQEIADLQVELKVKRLEKYGEIKDLLTPEQQAQLPSGLPSSLFGYPEMGQPGSGIGRKCCW